MGIDVALDTASIKAFVLKYLDANLDDWLATALSSARIGGSILLAVVGNAVLVPVVLFYLLIDWPDLIARVASPSCRRACAARRRLRRPSATRARPVPARPVAGDADAGGLLQLGLALFGFDLAVPVGVFTGLAIFVPYVGFGIGLVLALLAGAAAVRRLVRPDRGGRRLRHRPDVEGFVPDAADGRRAHRHEPAHRDLRAVRLRPPVRLRRRAARAAGQRADRWSPARLRARRYVAAASTSDEADSAAIGPSRRGPSTTSWPARTPRRSSTCSAGRAGAPPVYLWGPRGSGKTHLLHALAAARRGAGERVGWFDAATRRAVAHDGAGR